MATALRIPLAAAPALVLPETRGFYIEHAKGFSAEALGEEIDRAARAGFNVVVFPIYINGYTLFPSVVAREAPFDSLHPDFRRWDPLAVALERCHGHGMSLWGLARAYNFHPRYSAAPQRLLRRFPQWSMRIHPQYRTSPLRRRESYVACPINPSYRRYLAGLLAEVVMAYPIDGVVLNLSGYGLRGGSLEASPFCFCPACAERYRQARGADLIETALTEAGIADVRQWQTEASMQALEYIRHRVIKTRRTLRLLCRAQPQWRWNADFAGPMLHAPYCLDWNRALGSGIVEALIVDHDDERAPELFSARLVSDLAELHQDALFVPAVQVERPEDLEAPLAAVRRYPVSGLVVEWVEAFEPDQADAVRRRFFSEPASVPEGAPLPSVALLLRRIGERHAENPLIGDFMRDFLRLVRRAFQDGASYHDLSVILENLVGLQEAIRRRRLGGYHVPESTLRDLSLARRILRLALLDVRS